MLTGFQGPGAKQQGCPTFFFWGTIQNTGAQEFEAEGFTEARSAERGRWGGGGV